MAAKPSKKQLQDTMLNALTRQDAAGVLAALDNGLQTAWQDAQGRTALHYAAAWGNDALAERLMEKGVPPALRDNDAQSPADIAALYGHASLARAFAKAAEATAPAPLPYATLAQLRHASQEQTAKGHADVFYALARAGRFAEVVALAEKTGEGFCRQDFLELGADGNTTAEVLAASGQFSSVLKPALWVKSGQDFQDVWHSLSAAHRQGIETQGFMEELRQARLSSYVKPQLRPTGKGAHNPKKQ